MATTPIPAPPRPTGRDGRSVPRTTDALCWATTFCRTIESTRGVALDPAAVATWFNNALAAGYADAIAVFLSRRRRVYGCAGDDPIRRLFDKADAAREAAERTARAARGLRDDRAAFTSPVHLAQLRAELAEAETAAVALFAAETLPDEGGAGGTEAAGDGTSPVDEPVADAPPDTPQTRVSAPPPPARRPANPKHAFTVEKTGEGLGAGIAKAMRPGIRVEMGPQGAVEQGPG